MKKIFTVGAIALTVFAGVGVAVAENVANRPKANAEVYSWNRTGGEGSPEEQNPYVGTKEQAENYFGCSGTIDECAVGAPLNFGVPAEVIYQH